MSRKTCEAILLKLRTPIRHRPLRLSILLATALALATMLVPSAGFAATWTAGQPVALPFPRVACLWPLGVSTPAQIAGFDYAALQSPDRNAALRALNPDIILLHSYAGQNACEVTIDASKSGAEWPNTTLAKASARWILTQVGTTLSSAIGTATTTIPVKATTAGSPAIALFKAGDILVIDDELCQVQAVGATALTVKRGVVFPAQPHAAGTRAAAAVPFVQGEVVMDMSANCPKVTVDPAVGPESWCDWEARTAATLVGDSTWDGAYVDRTDGSESWLVTAGYTRSIDPNRSNTLSGSYAAFDASWNTGMRSFEQKLRTLVGPARIILANNSVTNYDALNGTSIEEFPAVDTSPRMWRQVVFGPQTGVNGSYLDWLAGSRQPNLSTIETYQYDTVPGSPVPPAGWQSDPQTYRRMRFGLTTALLGDGFFAGRPGTVPLWLDEYDNAGAGKGYLGQPLGSAYSTTPQKADLVSGDGAFGTATQLSAWTLQVTAGSAAKALDSGACKVNTTLAGGAGTQRLSHPVTFTAGKTYRVTFRAWATSPRALGGYLTNGQAGASVPSVQLTAQRQDYSVVVTPAFTGGNSGTLKLSFGDATGSIWIANVVVREAAPEVWRRDFDKGTVLVNAEATTQTVSLGGTFRKIKGTQAPTVNDGSLVTAVTLPPRDGIVLLRPAPTGSLTVEGSAAYVSTTTVTAASNVLGADEMRIDASTGAFGGWQPYAASVRVTLPSYTGTKSIRIEYRNLAGTLQLAATVNLVDSVGLPSTGSPTGGGPAPFTLITGVPFGWSSHDVTFSLGASATASSGGISTFYGLSTTPPIAYSTPVTVTDQGVTTVSYFSVDGSGCAETTRSATIRIDKTPPLLSLESTSTYTGFANIHAVASDALSGLDHVELSLDGGPWSTGGQLSVSTVGAHVTCARAFDVAGNECDADATFTVIAAPVAMTTAQLTGPSRVRVKKALKLSGTISPLAAPGRVTIARARLVGKKWRSAGSVKVAVIGGRFSYTFKPKSRGKWRFVASYSGSVVDGTRYGSSRSGIKSALVK